MTAKERKACGGGPYILTVDSPAVTDVQPLEVLVRTEPDVVGVSSLPAADVDSRFSDQTQGNTPAGTDAVSAIGSPSFAGAPPVVPGRYSDSILPGETLYFRVPDVDWGQQVVCDFLIGPTAQAKAALGDDDYQSVWVGRVYGPLKNAIIDPSATEARGTYSGKEPGTTHVATP